LISGGFQAPTGAEPPPPGKITKFKPLGQIPEYAPEHIQVTAGKQVTVNFLVSLQKKGGQKILLTPPFFKRVGRRPLDPPLDQRLLSLV